MTSAAKQNASPPEFLIQRNLILQKRSTSVTASEDNGEDSGNLSSNSDVSIGGPLKGKNDRENISPSSATSSGALGPGGTAFKGVHPCDEKTGSARTHSSQQLQENRTRGNTASGSRGSAAAALVVNRRNSPGATSRFDSAAAPRLSRTTSTNLASHGGSDKETFDRDASFTSKNREFPRQGLTRTGRKMGEDYSDASCIGGNRPNFSGKASSDSGSDISLVNSDIERIITSNRYNKMQPTKNGVVSSVAKESESPQEQEFSYGPGFVDKLKSRFISLSLRDKVKSGNALRRFSSLENVLDSDAEYPNNDVIKRKRPIGTANNAAWSSRYNKSAPAKSSFKRAKSMETLLLESERRKIPSRGNGAGSNKNRPVSMIDSVANLTGGQGLGTLGLINENLVIIESPKGESQPEKPDNVINNNVLNRAKNNKNAVRQLSNISDEELPKPDIVKTCKLIFETGSKSVATTQVNGTTTPTNVICPAAITNANTRNGKIATAAATTTTTTIPRSAKNGVTTNSKTSATLPKTFATQQPQVVTNNVSAKDLVNDTKVINESKVNKDSVVGGGGGGTKRDVVFTNGEVFRNDGSVSPSNRTSPDSEIKQRQEEDAKVKVTPDVVASTTLTNETSKAEGVKESVFSPTTNSNTMIFNGTTMNSNSAGGGGLLKSAVPRPPTLNTSKSAGDQVPKTSPLNSKEVTPSTSPLSPQSQNDSNARKNSAGSPTRGITNSRLKGKLEAETKNGAPLLPVLAADTNGTPAPKTTSPASTSDAVEETAPKTAEDEVLKASTLLGNKKPGLWQKAPRMTTTIVYDFRGKDVKSHLPTNPAPFGCAPTRVKKKKQSDNREGLQLKNGIDLGDFSGGESNDYEDSDDEYDETDVGAHLPAKSGINFIGENAKCSKSSLLTIRNKKLKLQFDDDATSTFEYPSEEWIYEDTSALLAATAGTNLLETVLSPDNQRPQPTTEDANDEDAKGPNTGLRNSPGLTSTGGLSNYTPSMLSSTESSFQLGVSRMAKEEPSSQKESSVDSPSSTPVSGSHADEDDLLPADPEQTSSWSSSTSTSDLLF